MKNKKNKNWFKIKRAHLLHVSIKVGQRCLHFSQLNLKLICLLLFWKEFLQLVNLCLTPIQLLLDGLDFGGDLFHFLAQLLYELINLRLLIKMTVAGWAAGVYQL